MDNCEVKSNMLLQQVGIPIYDPWFEFLCYVLDGHEKRLLANGTFLNRKNSHSDAALSIYLLQTFKLHPALSISEFLWMKLEPVPTPAELLARNLAAESIQKAFR
jgi:hypothetical protein